MPRQLRTPSASRPVTGPVDVCTAVMGAPPGNGPRAPAGGRGPQGGTGGSGVDEGAVAAAGALGAELLQRHVRGLPGGEGAQPGDEGGTAGQQGHRDPAAGTRADDGG